MTDKCYRDKFHPTRTRCARPATWRSSGTGNFTDSWTWCDEHAPRRDWLIRITERTAMTDGEK